MYAALSNEPILWTTGWVLFNSLWLVALVWVMHWLIQRLLRNSSAQARYRAACTMLVVMIASLLLLGWIVWTNKPVTDWVISPEKLVDSVGHWSVMERDRNEFLATLILFIAPVSVSAAMLWIAVAVTSMAWLVASWRRVHAFLRDGRPMDDDEFPEFHALQQGLLPGRTIPVRVTGATISPATAGWLRPVVILPEASLRGLTSDQLRCVVAHELAHIQRRDYLVNLGQSLCELVLIYHPLARGISTDIRNIREECCDDIAAAASGGPKNYGKALLAMDDVVMRSTLALQATGGSLYDRIERLVKRKRTPGRELPVRFATALLLACVVLFATTVVVARATERARIEADISRMHFGEAIGRDLGFHTEWGNSAIAPEMRRLVARFQDPYSIPQEELETMVEVLSRGTRGNELICEQLLAIDLTSKLNDFTPTPLPVGDSVYWGRVAVRIWQCGKTNLSQSERQRWGVAAVALACQQTFGSTHLMFILKDPDAGEVLAWSPTVGNRISRIFLYAFERSQFALRNTVSEDAPRGLRKVAFSQVAFNPRGAMLYVRSSHTPEDIATAMREMEPYLPDPVVHRLYDLLVFRESNRTSLRWAD